MIGLSAVTPNDEPGVIDEDYYGGELRVPKQPPPRYGSKSGEYRFPAKETTPLPGAAGRLRLCRERIEARRDNSTYAMQSTQSI